MDARAAAGFTADAILDAQYGFASKHRRQAVREHCVGTDRRIEGLEAQVRDLQSELKDAYKILRRVAPECFD